MNKSARGLTAAHRAASRLGDSRLWAVAARSHHMLPVPAGNHELPSGDNCQQRSPGQQLVCLGWQGAEAGATTLDGAVVGQEQCIYVCARVPMQPVLPAWKYLRITHGDDLLALCCTADI